MGYEVISDFSGGVDLRKSDINSPQGTLRQLTNGFVTAGGEIQKRKVLTSMGAVPSNTFGAAYLGSDIVLFGTVAPGAVGGLPSYVTYQQLLTPKTISRVLDFSAFGNKLYVAAKMTDDTVQHFYDGALQTATSNPPQGTTLLAHKSKMYTGSGNILRFSNVGNAGGWDGTGNGFIDVSTVDNGSAQVIGLEKYYDKLAVFGRRSIQMWSMDEDPALNTRAQVIDNTGLVAAQAVAAYGGGDVLYLANTGVRSLRARDSSNAAGLNDVGSPIDEMIMERRAVLTNAVRDKIKAVVDPITGQVWLAWGREVFVLSHTPNGGVSAWSVFLFPVTVDHIVVAGARIVIRAGDELFIYGSIPVSGSPFTPDAPLTSGNTEYDTTSVEIVLPMVSLKRPATIKQWEGIDVACEGEWDVFAAPSHKQSRVWTQIGTVVNSTFEDERIPLDFSSTHLALKFVSKGNGVAKFLGVGIHHNLAESS